MKICIKRGMIGLIKAVDTYKADSTIIFSTYACVCIENEIKQSVRKNKTLKRTAIVLSFEEPVSEDLTLGETLGYEHDFDTNITNSELYKAINTLDDKDYELIHRYYGLKNSKDYNQTELAKLYGVNQASISRRLDRINQKLKNIMLII